MARTDAGIIGQGAQLLHAVKHLRGRAFKQAATAKRHKTVGGEGCIKLRHVKRDVA